MRRFALLCLIVGGAIWLLLVTLYPSLPSKQHPLFVYSNQLRNDLKLLLLRAIKSAKHSIHMQIYALTDKDIKEILKKKSQEGIEVTLFYDQGVSPFLQDELLPYGILSYPTQCRKLMHRKIFIIDNEYVYLSSANLTTQSLKMHDNVILGIWHPQLAGFCLASMEACKTVFLEERSMTLFLLPEAKEIALKALLEVIHTAEKRIDVALFTLTHPDIVQALIERKKKGIEVNIAIDYFARRGASRLCVETLQANGISIRESRGQQLLHHKWAVIDDKKLLFGSANWTKAAFRENQDFLVILSPLRESELRSFKKIGQAF